MSQGFTPFGKRLMHRSLLDNPIHVFAYTEMNERQCSEAFSIPSGLPRGICEPLPPKSLLCDLLTFLTF